MTISATSVLFSDEEKEEITTPILFPTLVSARYEEGSVALSFELLKKDYVVYRVYRSSSPILYTESFSTADLVAESADPQIPLRDFPERDGKYFYAVTAIVDGVEGQSLIPYQNTMISAIDFAPFPEAIDAFELEQLSENLLALRFRPLKSEYGYNLYVSERPLFELDDLSPLQTREGTDTFEIAVTQDVPYHFAVTTVNRLGSENRTLTPGKNASVEPYKTKTTTEERKKEVAPKEVVKIEYKPAPQELITSNLRTNFYAGNYSSALGVFRQILGQGTLSEKEKSSVYFYMGQCYFYLEDYEKAIRSFIMSKEDPQLNSEADAWVDRCLERVY